VRWRAATRLPLHSFSAVPSTNQLAGTSWGASASTLRTSALALATPSGVAESSTSFGWGIKGVNVTCAGWQVTLCDPTWHVSCRSGVATLRTAMHLLLSLRILLSSSRSSYTNLIDTQLHSAMRLISGCLQPTQLSWLPHTGVSSPQYDRRPNYE